jgi:Spermine/spermidine synthase domain
MASIEDQATGAAGSPRMIRSFRYLLGFAFFGSLALPPFAVLASVMSTGTPLPPGANHKLVLYAALVPVALAVFYLLLARAEPYVLTASRNQAAFLEKISGPWLSVAIAGSAGLSLFLELAVIRWQGTIFEFFAFYKNYGLLACFAGLGLGYALCRSDNGIPLNLSLPLLSWQAGLLIFLRFGLPTRSLEMIPFREQLNMGVPAAKPVQIAAVYLLLTVVFLLTALAFIPVGQLCGNLMERKSQLSAYGLNLFGSVLGVCLIFLLSFLWTPPVVWFGLSGLALLFFLTRTSKSLFVGMGFATLMTLILVWPVNPLWNKVYSPYQLLEIGYTDTGFMQIRAAGTYYQRVYDLSEAALPANGNPELRLMRDYYELPYRIGVKPNEVAIVGAGSGNDVAAALRSGAQHVDAIEIDPAILLAGKANHPEKPYDDPRVQPVVNDARSFLRNSRKRYDIIVYGLLDSHTLLSHASSVRLDSFVYTVEGLREARSHLKDTGVLSLSFSVLNNDLGAKIYRMMREAFDGQEPVCLFAAGNTIFLQSKNGRLVVPAEVLSKEGVVEQSAMYRSLAIRVDLSTDDWPFLYMPRRIYPVSYVVMIGLVLLLSVVLHASFFHEKPQTTLWPFFFLGAGFMLVETKAITELGLAFGNTWHVIAITIASILVMAFLANAIVQWLRISSPYLSYLLLFASLVLGWWVARSGGLPSTFAGRVGTAIVLTCPLFFSGIVFSALLSRQSRISSVMSMNLLGAMCGGILEYNSMYFGFRFLYLLAMGLYAAALLSGGLVGDKRSLATTSEQPAPGAYNT